METLIPSGTAVPSSFMVTRSALTVAALALVPAVFMPGSGGLANVETLISRHHLFEASAAPVTLNYTEARTIAEQIDYLRAVLGTSITDLAELLGVTRPTVYAWMKGADVRLDHVSRVDGLVLIAQELELAGIENLPKLFKRKLSSGVTLMELVRSAQPFDHLLPELAALSGAESRQRAQRKGGQHIRSTADVAQIEGIASYTQDA